MKLINNTGVVADSEFVHDDGTPVHGVCSAWVHFKDNKSLVTATLEMELVKTDVSVQEVKYEVRHPVTGDLVDITNLIEGTS
jgi:hypothetical protein